MTAPPPLPRRRWGRTFILWHLDEKFWRDIWKNVLSAIIIGLLAYLFLLIVGVAHVHVFVAFELTLLSLALISLGTAARMTLTLKQRYGVGVKAIFNPPYVGRPLIATTIFTVVLSGLILLLYTHPPTH